MPVGTEMPNGLRLKALRIEYSTPKVPIGVQSYVTSSAEIFSHPMAKRLGLVPLSAKSSRPRLFTWLAFFCVQRGEYHDF